MNSKKVFRLAWFKYFTVMTIAIVVILALAVILIKIVPGEIFWLLFVLPFIYYWIVWSNKVIVPPNYEYIYEWKGKELEPLTSGYNYVFPYRGHLNGRAKISMNVQTLNILIGVRDGLPESIVKDYIFGTASNIRPEEGDTIRILCQVEYQNIDSLKLLYAKDKPFHYIASLIEFKISAYMKKPIKDDSEALSDHFLSKDWDAEVLDNIGTVDNLRDEILDFIGVKLIHVIPVNLLFSPEVEKSKKDAEIEKRRKDVLTEEASNVDLEVSISKKRNETNVNAIETIMAKAGISGTEALNFIIKEKTLNAITQASKTGNITYIDGSGDSSLSNGVGFGWGINATKTKSESEKSVPEKTDEKKDDKKSGKKK